MQLQVLSTPSVAPVKSRVYGGHQLPLARPHDRIQQRLVVQQDLQHHFHRVVFG
jgi:hypothetical protein